MKPILFNTDMVRALLDGRKTMTRRVCKLDTANFDYDLKDKDYGPFLQNEYGDSINVKELAPYQVGDILYVRETWAFIDNLNAGVGNDQYYEYKADTNNPLPGDWPLEEKGGTCLRWKPSIHMPKEAARIWLEVTKVRVGRLQEITGYEAIAEGIDVTDVPEHTPLYTPLYRFNEAKRRFIRLWDSTIKNQDLPLYGWDSNPWVWVYEFKRVEGYR